MSKDFLSFQNGFNSGGKELLNRDLSTIDVIGSIPYLHDDEPSLIKLNPRNILGLFFWRCYHLQRTMLFPVFLEEFSYLNLNAEQLSATVKDSFDIILAES
ncbi:hypothetical protein H6F53_25955 [Trichocoleus sp. FACHB-832]|uniref:hypothetical protein n=1 Tax=Trichocoleus sp. FACHB-832 TaxID=2692875 RepID=UPI00168969EB|nr:hypothetical protein [Trichocoleus sp. FACHB-832]MBD1908890.1 hypothetical protein [Trichocoleus sp. FACHB-832]